MVKLFSVNVSWLNLVQPLAKSLGVKSVPTFKIIRKGQVITEVIGAKYDALVQAIVANNTAPISGGSSPQSAHFDLIAGKCMEVDKDSFYNALKAAGKKLVLLDMYTDW